MLTPLLRPFSKFIGYQRSHSAEMGGDVFSRGENWRREVVLLHARPSDETSIKDERVAEMGLSHWRGRTFEIFIKQGEIPGCSEIRKVIGQ